MDGSFYFQSMLIIADDYLCVRVCVRDEGGHYSESHLSTLAQSWLLGWHSLNVLQGPKIKSFRIALVRKSKGRKKVGMT